MRTILRALAALALVAVAGCSDSGSDPVSPTITVAVTAVSPAADDSGAPQYTIAGRAVDGQGAPLAVRPVVLTIAGASGTITPSSVSSTAAGTFSASISNVTRTGTFTLSARDGLGQVPGSSITFTIEAATPTSLALVTSATSLVVGTTAGLSGTVLDRFGNGAGVGQSITMTVSGGNGSVSPAAPVLSSDGTYSGVLTAGTLAGPATLTATLGALQADVALAYRPDVPSAAFPLTLVPAFQFLTADGLSQASTAVSAATPARDAFGNVVAAGTAFQLNFSGGALGAKINGQTTGPVVVTTAANGTFGFTVTAGTTTGAISVAATPASGTGVTAFPVTLAAIVAEHQRAVPSSGTTGTLLFSGDVNHDGKLDLVSVYVSGAGSVADILFGDGAGSFAAPVTVALANPSGGAIGVAVGGALADLNRDGFLDLVLAVPGNLRAFVYAGRSGTQAFAANASAQITIGSATPVRVRVADMDADDRLDLLLASGTAADLYLQASTPPALDGTTFPSVTRSFTTSLGAIALGDVTLDGFPDIVAINAAGQSLTVFENTSGVIASISGPFTVALGAEFSGGAAQDLALADVDRNGDVDVIVAGGSVASGSRRGRLVTRLNSRVAGVARFTTQRAFAIGAADDIVLDDIDAIRVIDHDRDRLPEIFLSVRDGRDPATSRLVAFLELATAGAGFVPAWSVTQKRGGDVVVGDFDRDGVPEIVTEVPALAPPAVAPTALLSVLGRLVATKPGFSGFTASGSIRLGGAGFGGRGLAVADFTRSGSPSVLLVGAPGSGLTVLSFQNSRTARVSVGSTITNLGGGVTLSAQPVVREFIQDGSLHVGLFRFGTQAEPDILENDGLGLFVSQNAGASVPYPFLVAGRFVAGGGPDLFVLDPLSGAVAFQPNFGGTGALTPQTTSLLNVPTPSAGAAGDFNGDGFDDVAYIDTRAPFSTRLTFLMGKPYDTPVAGTFVAEVATIPGGSGVDFRAIAAGDVNGDGLDDVIVLSPGRADVFAILPAGGGGRTLVALDQVTLGFTPRFAVTGDFNRDGRLDFATAEDTVAGGGGTAGDLRVFLGSGSGTFTALGGGVLASAATQITGLTAADVDGNGVQDLVVLEAANLSILFGEK